ncbi:MAG: LysR family transcriptional regulator, partial [Xanthobacteraceae bacterium]|nr:LysR family transcriptional regulator [Xanthobacteraceae bacterium]
MDTAFHKWDTLTMVDLNDLRLFERIAAFDSFSKAASALGLPKSSISRSVGRLEQDLGIRLFQRSSRNVRLTPAGEALLTRASGVLGELDHAIEYASSLSGEPSGPLSVSVGIGFGVNVLSAVLPTFLDRYPKVDVSLDLTSREADLVAERVDVAIRMGAQDDSTLISTRLGRLPRYLCAAPAYVDRHGLPAAPSEIDGHACIEMPGANGRPRTWSFSRGDEVQEVHLKPRVSVNDALTIHHLVRNGAGLGVVSGYLCAPDFERGMLVPVCSGWKMNALDVSVVYPSRRELSPVVRAFVDFLRQVAVAGEGWQLDAQAVGLQDECLP